MSDYANFFIAGLSCLLALSKPYSKGLAGILNKYMIKPSLLEIKEVCLEVRTIGLVVISVSSEVLPGEIRNCFPFRCVETDFPFYQ